MIAFWCGSKLPGLGKVMCSGSLVIRLGVLICISAAHARSDVHFDECAGSQYGMYDVLPAPNGGWLPSRFEASGYRVAPFNTDECRESSVYVQGHRMARVQPLATEILDIDAGTMTTIDRAKRTATVRPIEAFKRRLARSVAGGVRLAIRFEREDQALDDSGNHPVPYNATGIAISGANKGRIALRAEYRMVPQIPFREVTNFLEDCINKLGPDDGGVCSLGISERFGALDVEARKLGGYAVQRIVEWTVAVPMGGDYQPGTRVFRSISRLSGFKSEPADADVFTMPAHFRVRHE
jgi:hypothetical protein